MPGAAQTVSDALSLLLPERVGIETIDRYFSPFRSQAGCFL